MMTYGTRLGEMFYEGAPKLVRSGLYFFHCRPNASYRIAVEAKVGKRSV